jgi:hypothetical protein
MLQMVAIHKVGDYDVWREMVEERVARRRGVSIRVWRGVDDPMEIMVIINVPSMEIAEEIMAGDGNFREWMDRAGLEVYPAIFVGQEV